MNFDETKNICGKRIKKIKVEFQLITHKIIRTSEA